MSSELQIVKFKAGDTLFLENEESFHFYMIKKGQIEVYRIADDGKKVVLAVLEEGQSLGEFAMIDKKPRSASASALTDVIAIKVSEEGYASMLDELPTWARAMMESLVIRMRRANEIIEMNEGIDEDTRIDFKSHEFDTPTTTDIDFDELDTEDDEDFDFGRLASNE